MKGIFAQTAPLAFVSRWNRPIALVTSQGLPACSRRSASWFTRLLALGRGAAPKEIIGAAPWAQKYNWSGGPPIWRPCQAGRDVSQGPIPLIAAKLVRDRKSTRL